VGNEQRRNERHRVRFHLVYDDGSSFHAGTVHDVSTDGLFLETALPLAIGTEVTLTPVGEEEDLFEVRARVKRYVPYDPNRMQDEPAGMGLQFLDLSESERERVVGLIRKLETKFARAAGEKDPFLGVIVTRERG
jgi:Tfp pilus assembly protein PilZ